MTDIIADDVFSKPRFGVPPRWKALAVLVLIGTSFAVTLEGDSVRCGPFIFGKSGWGGCDFLVGPS